MENIQFIQVTPEKLQKAITDAIKVHLDDLKKEFQPKPPSEYLTRKEVAQLFKIDLSSVHNWTKKGKLKRHALGGRVYYKREEIEKALVEI